MEYVSAYTVAELGDLLPTAYCSWWYTKKDGVGDTLWRAAASQYDDEPASAEAATEADARAKMLIYLLENKLLTLPATGPLTD
jgi:hypothetical protein